MMAKLPEGLVISSGWQGQQTTASTQARISAAQARDRKILRELMAQRGGMPGPLSDTEKAVVERLAGRKLTQREAIAAEVYRQDTRSFERQYRQSGFRAVMATCIDDPLDAAIVRATENSIAEREALNLKNMTPSEIELHQLKKARELQRVQRETEAAREQRMAERAETIDALRLELAIAMADPTYDAGDIADIKNALTQNMEPDSCPEACKTMAAEALGISAKVNARLFQAVLADLAERQAEAAEIRTTLNIVADPADVPTTAEAEAARAGAAQ